MFTPKLWALGTLWVHFRIGLGIMRHLAINVILRICCHTLNQWHILNQCVINLSGKCSADNHPFGNSHILVIINLYLLYSLTWWFRVSHTNIATCEEIRTVTVSLVDFSTPSEISNWGFVLSVLWAGFQQPLWCIRKSASIIRPREKVY
jgi:hypothetical protein